MQHHVYFWLSEEKLNQVDRAAFEDGLENLLTSPHISSSYWSKPADTESRPVTDHSWSYAIWLKFDSMEAHDLYQNSDPIHDEFIASYKDWWAKVLVMDLA